MARWREHVAAISCGVHNGQVVLDLDSSLRFIPVAAWHNGTDYLGSLYPLVRRIERQHEFASAPTPKIAGFGLSEPHTEEPTTPLPWVRVELDGVVKTGPSDDGSIEGDIYLDEQFSPDAYFDALDSDASMIHVTGHFKMEPGELRYSRFYTGGGDFLYADRLFTGRRDTGNTLEGVRLMMLPSCETALDVKEIAQLGKDRVSRERSFEGEGLATGVIGNGADALIASLWHVEDASTSTFVQTFYDYVTQDLTPAQALMHTRRDFLKDTVRCESMVQEVHQKYSADQFMKTQVNYKGCSADWTRPYYWAGLTLFVGIQ